MPVFVLISASLTQAVRNFAKGLEGWLVNSLDQIPKKMADVKVSSTIVVEVYLESANPQFVLEKTDLKSDLCIFTVN